VELNRECSAFVTRQTVIAYWLIPSEPAYSQFQQIINDLARQYDAAVFEPHVTVHVGADRADAARIAVAGAARECKPVTLMPLGVDHSDEFTKTLFLQFAMSAELQKINQLIRQTANDSSKYEPNPHLSLLYKNMAATARHQLAASITLPFPEVTFDAIRIVRCSSPTRTGRDVNAWQVLGVEKLAR
jgi:2'-5' RNA ligase